MRLPVCISLLEREEPDEKGWRVCEPQLGQVFAAECLANVVTTLAPVCVLLLAGSSKLLLELGKPGFLGSCWPCSRSRFRAGQCWQGRVFCTPLQKKHCCLENVVAEVQ